MANTWGPYREGSKTSYGVIKLVTAYFSLGWATRESPVFGLENKVEVELLSIHILIKI